MDLKTELDQWDKVASIFGGLVLVISIVWNVLVRTVGPLRESRERRLQWRKHIQAIGRRAAVLPGEGLAKGETNALLSKTYVQLAVKSTALEKASRSPVAPSTHEFVSGDIWQLLRSRPETVLFVLGRPGVGKTTLIHHVAGELADLGGHRAVRVFRAWWRGRPDVGPFWIRLRDFVSDPDMIAALDRELWEPAAPSIVLVDGLDEVPDAQRPAVAAWITKRASAGGRRWVVTLRPEGFEMLGVDCCYLEVQPLDLPRIEALVKAHFGDDPAKALTLIADIRRRETYYQFARNPLLLRMMVDLHRSGNSAETRVEMYRKILLSVLDQRMRDKHGQVTMDGEQLLKVLGKVAWEMGERLEVTEDELRKMIDRHTRAPVEEQVRAAFHFFPGDKHRREFAHRSFQEYLAATEVSEVDPRDLFDRRTATKGKGSFWDETVRFYALLSPERFGRVFAHCQTAADPDLMIACGLEIPASEKWQVPRTKFTAWLNGQLNDPLGWRAAAEARLSVRLRSLEPRGGDAVADTSLVTHAELQLFLDTDTHGEHAPPHWTVPHFPAGTGAAPALGVSSRCAEAFGEWVSERDKAARYAVPAGPDEQSPMAESGSYWCRSEQGYSCWPLPATHDSARDALGRLAGLWPFRGQALA